MTVAMSGKVTVVTPFTVILDDGSGTATTAVSKLATYTPVVDDRVVLLRVGARWVGIGRIG